MQPKQPQQPSPAIVSVAASTEKEEEKEEGKEDEKDEEEEEEEEGEKEESQPADTPVDPVTVVPQQDSHAASSAPSKSTLPIIHTQTRDTVSLIIDVPNVEGAAVTQTFESVEFGPLTTHVAHVTLPEAGTNIIHSLDIKFDAPLLTSECTCDVSSTNVVLVFTKVCFDYHCSLMCSNHLYSTAPG